MKLPIFAELFIEFDADKYCLLSVTLCYISFGMAAEKGIVPLCRYFLFYHLLFDSIS